MIKQCVKFLLKTIDRDELFRAFEISPSSKILDPSPESAKCEKSDVEPKTEPDYDTPLLNEIYSILLSIINNPISKTGPNKGAPTEAYSGLSNLICILYCDYSNNEELKGLIENRIVKMSPSKKSSINKALTDDDYELAANILLSEVKNYILKIVKSRFLDKVRDERYEQYRRTLFQLYKNNYRDEEIGNLIYLAESNKSFFGFSAQYDKYDEEQITKYSFDIDFSNFINPLNHGCFAKDMDAKNFFKKMIFLFWKSFVTNYRKDNVVVPIRTLVDYDRKFYKKPGKVEPPPPSPPPFPPPGLKEIQDILDDSICKLDAREQQIIKGVMNDISKTEIAINLGITNSRVTQIKETALRKLLADLRKKGITSVSDLFSEII
ncbi:MAG TPA: hypothetical protein PLI06_10130 [Methanofastidiosum sp.]|nr:hypothetical protein [Methanofastidiosum sp.]